CAMWPPWVAASGSEGSLAPCRCRAPPSSSGTGMSDGNTLGSCAVVMAASISTQIGDKLEQRAVGVAKIYARSRTLRAEALDRPGMDRHAQALKMGNGVGNRPAPLETKVALAQ